ncbi:hypothetical protein [Novosphingobium sp.]|uniref:hypothetical protein n=1 Tax=Novosphingobium sp. TaxID=1874826 RepID=UPI003BAB3060
MTDPDEEAGRPKPSNDNNDFDAYDHNCPLCRGDYSEEWLAEIVAAAEGPCITMTADEFAVWLSKL